MFQKLKTFSFTGSFRIPLIISIVFACVGLIGLIVSLFGVRVFNYDIDFVGGTTMQFELHQAVDADVTADISDIVKEVTGSKPSSVIKAGDSGTQIVIKTTELSSEIRDEVFSAVQTAYSIPAEETPIKSDFVSASVGNDLKRSAVTAAGMAVLLILIYISIRFQLFSGLAAVIALMHDLLVMLSVYIIFQIPFNMNFIAAALTILGYSINATIVVFDRIRENRKLDHKVAFGAVVDKSIRQTMTRSINTTLTTLFSIVMLLIFGVSSIRNFALPVCVGIICGCYSSVFLSGPFWNLFESARNKKKAA